MKFQNRRSRRLRGPSIILFTLIVITILVCLAIIVSAKDAFETALDSTLTQQAAGLLLILILVFLMYKMFEREEYLNAELSSRLQQVELESRHINEIDAMYSDIRKWKHEYRNNLLSLRALVELKKEEEALAFIDNMDSGADRYSNTLQTGNIVLDAVVSSKLWYAKSKGIEVSIHAVYPEDIQIDDNDLCSLVGNLLDNAIEACLRINGDEISKVISFSLLSRSRHLELSIRNSYDGVLRKKGERFLSVKDEVFHGIGTGLIDSIVEKHHGHIIRESTNCEFDTHIVIPLLQAGKGNDYEWKS